MSTNVPTTFDGFNATTYCLNPDLFPRDTCPGICINKDMSGNYAVIFFVLSTVITGMGMIWLPIKRDRHHIYALSYGQTVARLTNVLVFFYTRKLNVYDTYLNMFLLTGAELTALIGAAPGLGIVGHKWGVGLLKPFGVLVACVSIGAVAGGYRPEVFKDTLNKISLLNDKHFGSQPACSFPAHVELVAPLIIASAFIIVGVALAHWEVFKNWLLHLGDFWGAAGAKDPHHAKLRRFWTLVIIIIDALWITFLWLFIKSYRDLGTVLNLNQDQITASQLFSMFLSAITLLPPVKHLFDRVNGTVEDVKEDVETAQEGANTASNVMGYANGKGPYG